MRQRRIPWPGIPPPGLKTSQLTYWQRDAGAVGVLKGLPEVDGFSPVTGYYFGQPDMDARQRARERALPLHATQP